MIKSHGQDACREQNEELQFSRRREESIKDDRQAHKCRAYFSGKQKAHVAEIKMDYGTDAQDGRHKYLSAKNAGKRGQIRGVRCRSTSLRKQQKDSRSEEHTSELQSPDHL